MPTKADSAKGQALSADLATNRNLVEQLFSNCSDVIYRDLKINQVKLLVIHIEGLVDDKELQQSVLRTLMNSDRSPVDLDVESLLVKILSVAPISKIKLDVDAVEALLNGFAVLFIDGYSSALKLDVKAGLRRAIEEPQSEQVIRGPREGFTEMLRVNTSLVRNKIRSADLKVVRFVLGSQSRTNVDLLYMGGTAPQELVDEVTKRIKKIEVPSVLETGIIEEWIEDSPYSPFPQLMYTERPDSTAAQLLEGRVAIIVDGSPFALIAPITFFSLVQTSEDYYERFVFAVPLRWLRYTFLFVALYTPAIYVAVTTFHPDMVPTSLLFSIAAAREDIPFPAVVEVLMLELAFEALREAGIRLPANLGQAVGILGALVIGQAVVQAGIVSAPVVIVVSLTGIASFAIPRYNAAISIRLLRFGVLFLAAMFGLLGIVLAMVWIGLHACQLTSMGQPYLGGIAPYRTGWASDILGRAPWWRMQKIRRRAQ